MLGDIPHLKFIKELFQYNRWVILIWMFRSMERAMFGSMGTTWVDIGMLGHRRDSFVQVPG